MNIKKIYIYIVVMMRFSFTILNFLVNKFEVFSFYVQLLVNQLMKNNIELHCKNMYQPARVSST